MSRPRRRDRPGHHRALVTVVVVLGVVAMIVGGPWAYARFLAPEAPAPLAVGTTMTTPPSTPLRSLDPDGTWTVGEGSEAGYRIDEVLMGQEITVVGRTDQVTGELVVQDGLLTAARVVVAVESITTPESSRDAYFRRALDTSTYPEAILELTAPVDVAAAGRPGEDVTVEFAADLTLRGATVPVTVTAIVRVTGEGLEVAGSAPVTLADFELSAPAVRDFVSVDPTAVIEVRLLLDA